MHIKFPSTEPNPRTSYGPLLHAGIRDGIPAAQLGHKRYNYPRRSRSAIGVDTVFTLDVCMFVCLYVSALERKRLIGMT